MNHENNSLLIFILAAVLIAGSWVLAALAARALFG